jgi:hypothetical protein
VFRENPRPPVLFKIGIVKSGAKPLSRVCPDDKKRRDTERELV